jgi:alanine dehydrogenase
MAFLHMAVAARPLLERLVERWVTAIGCEIIETREGRLPVLAAISEIAGQMTTPLAMHLLRSSSGGRGILLGGSPGVPPAHVVILGAGAVGTWAARAASASGAQVTVLDIDTEKLRRLMVHLPNVVTGLADPDSVAAAAASADVLIGAVLVAGRKTPHVVSKEMVDSMRPGSVIIDVAIDQGGCVETSRPTTLSDPTYIHNGVLHYCVANLTADMGRSTSMALAQALLPYMLRISQHGIEGALRKSPELARGVYTHAGACVQAGLAETLGIECRPLSELLGEGGVRRP